MKEWEFDELIDMIKEDYEDFRKHAKKNGENNLQALERFFVENRNVIDEGICENTIIAAVLCKVLASIGQREIFDHQYEHLSNPVKNYDPSQMIGEISDDEINELTQMVKDASNILEHMIVI